MFNVSIADKVSITMNAQSKKVNNKITQCGVEVCRDTKWQQKVVSNVLIEIKKCTKHMWLISTLMQMEKTYNHAKNIKIIYIHKHNAI